MRWLTIIVVGCALSVSFWRTLTPSTPLFERKESDGSVVESYVKGGTRTQFSPTGVASEIMHIGSAERQLGSQVTALKSIRYQTQGDDDLRWDIEAQAGVLYEMTNELALQDGVTVYEATNQATLNTETMLLNMDRKHAEGHNEVSLTGRGSKTTGSGFELDLVANTATVKGNVKTQYE
ncbi:LPS export ABC transporter periplasmic protein LptC [Luminiphilus sp.]|jgi:LPS export ABC transporter protein LptC|nr:LPS export ABC transporter periplasmic protein LptC [Luminiphilus sp.]